MAADSLPKYMHPHSSARIIDNAVLTVSSSGLTNMFIALEAEKGMPNEATYITTQSEWIFNFGEPSYAKYGQSALNALNYINAGGGAWVIRVVPDDERFAALSLGIGFRKEQAFTNDQEKYRRLEMTTDQIKLWNLAQTDDKQKVAVDGRSGNFAILPLFYVEENGTINTALRLQTLDEIELYKAKNTDTTKTITAVAKKNVVTYSNPYVEFSGIFSQDIKLVSNANGYFVGEVGGVTFADPTSATSFVATILADHFCITDEVGTAIETETAGSATSIKVYETYEQALAAVDPDVADADKASHVLIFSGTVRIYAAAATTDIATTLDGALVALFGRVGSTTADQFKAELEGSEIEETGKKPGFGSKIKKDEKHTSLWLQDNRTAAGNARAVFRNVDITTFFGGDEIVASATNGTAKLTTRLSLVIGTADEASWDFSYEVYKEATVGQYIPVSSDLINDNTAFTKVEVDEWNSLHALNYKLGNEVTATALVNAAETTGATKNVSLFYVKRIVDGSPVFSEAVTIPEAYRFNRIKPSDSSEAMVPTTDKSYPVKAMETKYASIVRTRVAFSADVSTETNWKVAVDGGTARKLAVNDLEYVNYFNATPSLYTLSASEGKLSVTVDTTKAITADEFNTIRGTSYGKLFTTVTTTNDNVTTTSIKLRTDIDATEVPNVIAAYLTAEENGRLQNIVVSDIPVSKVMEKLANGATTGTATLDTVYGTAFEFTFAGLVPVLSGNMSVAGFNGTAALTFVSDSLENLTLRAYDDVDEGKTSITASQIPGEKIAYVRKIVEFDGSAFEGNFDYLERLYDTIGLVATTFSDFSPEAAADYEAYRIEDGIKVKNSDIWDKIEDAKEGYVVGAIRDEITEADQATLNSANFVEFCRFLPKGSGKWYNNLAVSLTYDDNFDGTYPDWSMFKLSVIEKSKGEEIVREQFSVSFDPDAVAATKESLFIEDVVNTYSSYLTCVVNYDNLQNFIETKLAVKDANNKVVTDEDDNEIYVDVDTVIKYIFNRIDLDEFNTRTFGEKYETTELAQYAFTSLMSAIGADVDGCTLDQTRYSRDNSDLLMYTEPFVSFWFYNTLTPATSLYLGGGSYGNGWGFEYEDDEGQPAYTSTLAQALVRAYNGTTDPFITNVNLCEFDLMFDANYDETVRKAMVDLASVTRQDCIVLLDQGLSIANATQAIDKRQNEQNYDTFYASIFTQHLVVNDIWSGKVIKVTPTFFLSSKIPSNDVANGKTKNFVGARRGTIAGFRSISYMPTTYEMSELYKHQVNYIERDAQGVFFATELTSQTKNTPLTLIHAVRAILAVKRDFLKISRNYRSEDAIGTVQAQLMSELNSCAAEYILQGAFKYITPTISSTDYDVQQKICRIDVAVAFVDIMERFVFSFIVER